MPLKNNNKNTNLKDVEKHHNNPLSNIVTQKGEGKIPIISEDDADYAKSWSEINQK